jgi:hypothetical protein
MIVVALYYHNVLGVWIVEQNQSTTGVVNEPLETLGKGFGGEGWHNGSGI